MAFAAGVAVAEAEAADFFVLPPPFALLFDSSLTPPPAVPLY